MCLTDYDRDLIKLIKAAKGDMQAVSYARDLRYYLVLWWSRQPHIAEALAEALAPTHSTPTHAKPALHTAAGPTTPPAQLNTPQLNTPHH
ncbi:MAG TPA: hypothetical protein VK157_07115, partial [Phycisphaerales bacterium]|nr:hypothetical protein [Phycisphaerales bacterium]